MADIERKIIITSRFDTEVKGIGEVNKLKTSVDKLSGKLGEGKKKINEQTSALKSARLGLTRARIMYFNLAVMLGVVAVAFKAIVKPALEAQHSITAIGAVTGKTNAVIEDQVRLLRRGTVFTLKETADAYLEVTKRGFEAGEAFEVMNAATRLAIGGFTTLDTASRAITQTITQFGMAASDSAHIANVLAGAAIKTATNVEQLANSLSYVAPIAASVDLTFEETVATMGLLADAGFRGSRAATGFRRVLNALIKPPAEAAQQFKNLGFSAIDASGEMKSMSRIVYEMNLALSKLGSEAERSRLILDTFGIRGAPQMSALLSIAEQTGRSIEDLTAELESGEHAFTLYNRAMESLVNQNKQLNASIQETLYLTGQDIGGLWTDLKAFFATMVFGIDDTSKLVKHLEALKKAEMELGIEGQKSFEAIREEIYDILELTEQQRAYARRGETFGIPAMLAHAETAEQRRQVLVLLNKELQNSNEVTRESIEETDKLNELQTMSAETLKKLIYEDEELLSILGEQEREMKKLIETYSSTDNIHTKFLKGLQLSKKIIQDWNLSEEESNKLQDIFNQYMENGFVVTEQLNKELSELVEHYQSLKPSLAEASSAQLAFNELVKESEGILDKLVDIETPVAKLNEFRDEYHRVLSEMKRTGEDVDLVDLRKMKRALATLEKEASIYVREISQNTISTIAKSIGDIPLEIQFKQIDIDIDAAKRALKPLATPETLEEYTQLNLMYDRQSKALKELAIAKEELNRRTESLTRRNEYLQDTLDVVSDRLAEVKNRMNEVGKAIDNIKSRRFEIRGISETDVEFMIRRAEMEVKRAEFAALGLGSAEEFLRRALAGSNEEFMIQLETVQGITEAFVTGKQEFEAWRKTLEETIRALVETSTDLSRDVTDVVQQMQTELLGTTYFDEGADGGMTQQQEYINALRMAQELFFGEERNQLEESEAKWEDRTNGVNTSAEQAIAALASNRAELESLRQAEQDYIEQQERLRNEIDLNIKKIEQEKRAYQDLVKAMQRVVLGGGGRGRAVGRASAGDYVAGTYTTPSARAAHQAYRAKHAQTGFDALVTQPSVFTVAENGPEHVSVKPSGVTNNMGGININIMGANKDGRQLAQEIKDELFALGG